MFESVGGIVKVHVEDIPLEGLELTEEISPGKISLDLASQGIIFVAPVNTKAKILKSGSEVFAEVKLEGPLEYTCSRCLAKFQKVFKKTFNLSREVKPGDVLDINEDIRQEMMVDYPMKLLCKADCKGLCPNCGQNLNVGNCDCKK